MNHLTRIVQQTIAFHHLIPASSRVLVALSGGPDSVALLCLLQELGYDVAAAHCNFRLRGEESEGDERFVRELCRRRGVELHVTAFDTADEAARRGVSIEMAARDLRYAYFNRLVEEEGYDVIAVAHHRDDNVETLLLNLLRGTGVKGLTGMRYVHGRVVRPLLDVGRQDLLDYLSQMGQTYVTDHTNLETLYKRNKIRRQLLPLMREINPSIDATLQATIGRLAEVDEWCEATLPEALRSVELPPLDGAERCLSLPDLMRLPSPHLLLFHCLHPYRFTDRQVADAWQCAQRGSQAAFYAPPYELVIDRGRLFLGKQPSLGEGDVMTLEVDTPLQLDDGRLTARFLSIERLSEIPRELHRVAVDAEGMERLQVRRIRPGDRFVPFGMKGSKLVSDFLTDRKKSLFARHRQLVVTHGEQIVWVVGERPAQPYAIREGSTRRVLLLEWHQGTCLGKNPS